MRYNGKHEVNYSIDIKGTLCGTILAKSDMEAKGEINYIEQRVHDALAREFKDGSVDYDLQTNVETDEPRITASEVIHTFGKAIPEFFAYTDMRLFQNLVEKCIDDINQELIGFGNYDPREATYADIIKCTWRAFAIAQGCDSEL